MASALISRCTLTMGTCLAKRVPRRLLVVGVAPPIVGAAHSFAGGGVRAYALWLRCA